MANFLNHILVIITVINALDKVLKLKKVSGIAPKDALTMYAKVVYHQS